MYIKATSKPQATSQQATSHKPQATSHMSNIQKNNNHYILIMKSFKPHNDLTSHKPQATSMRQYVKYTSNKININSSYE
jgi:hypothetical protein